MKRLTFVPVAAFLALAGCGGGADAPVATGDKIEAVAPPEGRAWSDNVEQTELGFRMGNPDAAIKLVEYGSYTCPHCRDFSAESHDPLIKDYVDTGKVSVEYRPMVRDGLDLAAVLISRCGGAEPFFALSTQLFANQDEMIAQIRSHAESAFAQAMSAPPEEKFVRVAELGNLIEFAKQRGLPEEKVRACLADPKAAEKIAQESQDVLDKHPEFPGTPSFFLNGTLLDNTASWSALKTRLNEAGA